MTHTIHLDGIDRGHATAIIAHGFLTLICYDKTKSSYPSGYFDTLHIPIAEIKQLLNEEKTDGGI